MTNPLLKTKKEIVDEFEKHDIHISSPRSLADKELYGGLKYLAPVIWDVLKPEISKFLSSSLNRLIREIIKLNEGTKSGRTSFESDEFLEGNASEIIGSDSHADLITKLLTEAL